MKKLVLLLLIVFVCGCSSDPCELDGKYVKDLNGNIYEVEANIGVTYFI